jgi:hypothetical protein
VPIQRAPYSVGASRHLISRVSNRIRSLSLELQCLAERAVVSELRALAQALRQRHAHHAIDRYSGIGVATHLESILQKHNLLAEPQSEVTLPPALSESFDSEPLE